MIKQKYTRGNWKQEGGVVTTDRRVICNCNAVGIFNPEEDLANATLVAAAPQMLKTLQKLRGRIELQQTVGQLTGVVRDWNSELYDIDQAIAVATNI